MHTTRLWIARRVLDRDQMAALGPGDSELGAGSDRVGHQAAAKLGVAPRLRDDARSGSRTDRVLIGLDNLVEPRRIDETFFSEQFFERFDSCGRSAHGSVVMMVIGHGLILCGE